jgi:hypothetical protein
VQYIDRVAEPNRVHGPVRVAVVLGYNLKHGPPAEPFESLDRRVFFAALRGIESLTDVPLNWPWKTPKVSL